MGCVGHGDSDTTLKSPRSRFGVKGFRANASFRFLSHLPLDLWLNGAAAAPLTPEMFPLATLYHRVTESGLERFDRTGTAQWEPVRFP